MTDYLARVAAIAERETAKADARRREMRERDQGFTALVDNLRAVFGQPHAVVVDGKRYGKEPLPFRRTISSAPPIPGVSDRD